MGDDPLPAMKVMEAARGSSNSSGNWSLVINQIGKTNFMILVLALGLSLGISVTDMIGRHTDQVQYEARLSAVKGDADRAEREARMLQYYLLELDAKFIKAGLEDPADGVAKKLDKQEKQP